MADITEAIRRMIYEYVVEGADKVMQTQEAVAASTTKTDKASLSLEKAFGGLERRYVETVRYQQDYQKVQEKVNAAVAQNPALQERANAVLAAAGEHFSNLAANATKGGIASEFFSKALNFILGPAGLVGAATSAIGIAVGYMAAQFQMASTTIEQALEEQNRLMNETKTAIDALIVAQIKLESADLRRLQVAINAEDQQIKLNKAMADAADLATRRITTPGEVPGEMGQAPTGLTPLKDPGYSEIAAAIAKMREAIAANQPGLVQFNNELARIAAANPGIKTTFSDLFQAAQASNQLEAAARMAAEALKSVAQVNLKNLQDLQAAEAAKRMAEAVSELAKLYPGMSVEVAKQLDSLNGVLAVAQARTAEERLTAQEINTQNRLLLEGKSAEEAAAVAAKERAVAEENITKAIEDQIRALENQVELKQAGLSGTEANTKAEQAGRDAMEKGATAHEAAQIEDLTRKAESLSKTKEQTAAIGAQGEEMDENRGKQQALTDGAFAYEMELRKNNWLAVDHAAELQNSVDAWGNLVSAAKDYFWYAGKFGKEQYESSRDELNIAGQKASLEKRYGSGNIEEVQQGVGMSAFTSYRVKKSYIDEMLKIPDIDIGTLDIGSPAAIQQSLQSVLSQGFKSGLEPLTRLVEAVSDPATQASMIEQALAHIQRTEMPNLARDEMIQTLNDRLEQLASSTDSLNNTMQQALSPYYSQDPRTTKLGFRAGTVGNPDWLTGAGNANAIDAILGKGATAPGMAGGGSFVVGGGYSANDNKIAMFPVASGEEVSVNRNRAQGRAQVINNIIDNRTVVTGSLDADTFSKLKVSKFQQAQRMRAGMALA